jgi:peptide/nickel transport system ATP-binding protein
VAAENVIEVRDLVKHFPIREGLLRRQVGAVHAVDGVSFDVRAGEALGIVGESGCGKSTTARLMMRLLDPTGGSITWEGRDIARASRSELKPLRREMQMIFQDPYSSLNPRKTVGTIIAEPFRIHGVETRSQNLKLRVQELMEMVGLNPEHYNRLPHEFSGGQRQRIGVARAIALKPKMIVADEPVSALDVSIQAQVINLLEDLQDQLGLTYLVIAHDLAVVRHIADVVGVMYLGALVEEANSDDLYVAPLHPYTRALMSAVPVPDPDVEDRRERILLAGDLPSPANPPRGCRFHTRCPWAQKTRCADERPALRVIEGHPGHRVACHWAEDIAAGRLRPHEVAVEITAQEAETPTEVAAPAEPASYL